MPEQKPPSGPAEETGPEKKKISPPKNGSPFKKMFIFFIAVPSIITTIYFLFFATDMYISESHFAVRGQESANSLDISSILSSVPSVTSQDSYVVVDYIRSRDMLEILNKKFNLQAHYENPEADAVSRLNMEATREDFLEYWQKVLEVTFDSTAGILKLRIRAFEPDMAKKIGDEILRQSELLINEMHRRSHEDNLKQARHEIELAEQRLTRARQAVYSFQITHEELSPETTAGSRMQLVSQLELEVAKTQAELNALQSYMQENSHEVVSLKRNIASLQNQINTEKKRLTGSEKEIVADLLKQYQTLILEQEFAEKQYLSAASSLESARIQMESKTGYIIPIQHPTLPQKAQYPKRLMASFLSFCGIFLGVGIMFLVITAIREHSGV